MKNKKKKKACNVRQILFEKGHGVCHYCFRKLVLEKGHVNTLTIDHVYPKSLGGANSLDNYVGACGDCNTRKSSHLTFIHPNLYSVSYTGTVVHSKLTRTYCAISSMPEKVHKTKHNMVQNTFRTESINSTLTNQELAFTMLNMPVRQTIVRFTV